MLADNPAAQKGPQARIGRQDIVRQGLEFLEELIAFVLRLGGPEDRRRLDLGHALGADVEDRWMKRRSIGRRL